MKNSLNPYRDFSSKVAPIDQISLKTIIYYSISSIFSGN